MVAVSVTEEEEIQQPVYYASRVLQAGKVNYTKTEKLIYALIIVARKLQ